MSKSEENLKAAFAGESQANRKYLAFAKKADEEGFTQVAKLFRAAAEAETVHAHNHLRHWAASRSTKENLEEAVNGEVFEFQKMYPGDDRRGEKRGQQGGGEGPSTWRTRWRRSTPPSTGRPRRPGQERGDRTTTCARCAGTPWRGSRPTSVPSAAPEGDVQEDGLIHKAYAAPTGAAYARIGNAVLCACASWVQDQVIS